MHRDSEPDLVFEDMTVMSDFELHCLCREEQVQCKRTLLLIIVYKKKRQLRLSNCILSMYGMVHGCFFAASQKVFCETDRIMVKTMIFWIM